MKGHHPQPAAGKPVGQATRGKTAHNRLRRVDSFLLAYDPALLRRTDGAYRKAWVVDLGFGDEPITTLETARRLRQHNPGLHVLGVEIDPERVASAQAFADEHTRFRLGGFNLPLQSWPDGSPETVRLIRAFNVLRQYEESAVAEAHQHLTQALLPGGLLIEGTSDPYGSIWVANLIRKPAAPPAEAYSKMEALVFSTNFRTGFDPVQFQAVLPKNAIHRVVPGEPIHSFFQAWTAAAQATSPFRVWGPRQWFVASARNLAGHGFRVNLRRKWLRKGWMVWEGMGYTTD
jgi:hypothetical protein